MSEHDDGFDGQDHDEQDTPHQQWEKLQQEIMQVVEKYKDSICTVLVTATLNLEGPTRCSHSVLASMVQEGAPRNLMEIERELLMAIGKAHLDEWIAETAGPAINALKH